GLPSPRCKESVCGNPRWRCVLRPRPQPGTTYPTTSLSTFSLSLNFSFSPTVRRRLSLLQLLLPHPYRHIQRVHPNCHHHRRQTFLLQAFLSFLSSSFLSLSLPEVSVLSCLFSPCQPLTSLSLHLFSLPLLPLPSSSLQRESKWHLSLRRLPSRP